MKRSIKIFAFGLSCLFFLGTMNVAKAANFLVAEDDGVLRVNSEETISNLYVAGNIIDFEQEIGSDLYVVGNVINLNGVIEDDLMAIGQTINLKNNIGGNAHLVASTITIENEIQEDMMAVGALIYFSADAKIYGDSYMAAGALNYGGYVEGELKIMAGDVFIDGVVLGDVTIYCDKLTIGDNAIIEGKLYYEAKNEATISDSAVLNGGVEYEKTEKTKLSSDMETDEKSGLKAFQIVKIMIGFLSLLFASLLVINLMRKFTEEVVTINYQKFGIVFLIGFAVLVLFPLLGFFTLFISLFTLLKTNLLLMYAYILLFSLAEIFAAIMIGGLIMKAIRKIDKIKIDWISVLVGVSVIGLMNFLKLSTFLVFFVFIVKAIFVWAAFGALIYYFYQKLTSN